MFSRICCLRDILEEPAASVIRADE